MTLRLNGSTSGYVELDCPAVGGNNNIKLPASNGSANNLLKNSGTAGELEFASNVNIDSSGRLLVGTSTSITSAGTSGGGAGWTPALQVVHPYQNVNPAGISLSRFQASNPYGAVFTIQKSRNDTIGSHAVVASGDELGVISFDGSNGTAFNTAATISAVVDATPGAADMPGRLVFSTTADGASSPTERMTIDSTGQVIVNAEPTSSSAGASIESGGSAFFAKSGGSGPLRLARTTSNGAQITFYNQGSTAGSITTNTTTSTQYNTSSDYRLKENVVPLTGAIDRVNQLQVHRFNFIVNPDTVVDGFIAHEAQAVVPECVTGEKDAVDDDGNPIYQGIDQSKLVPLLTAALQEAIAEIATLKDRVAALEAS